MAESLAAGTPVISFNRGAAGEIIEHDKSGFLVDTVDQMVKKMTEIDRLDRSACRKRFESYFTAGTMVNNYEKLYQRMLA